MAFANYLLAPRRRQRCVGGLVLIGLLIGVGIFYGRFRTNLLKVPSDMVRYFLTKETACHLESPARIPLQLGDPVFSLVEPEDLANSQARREWKLVGLVREIGPVDAEGKRSIEVEWTSPAFTPDLSVDWEYYATPESFSWVTQTILPEEKRKELIHSLSERIRLRQQDLLQTVEPVVMQSIQDLVPLVQAKLRESLLRQKPEIESLGAKYQAEIIEEKLIPLIQTEILPILQEKSRPLMSKIGAELFERASLWRFTWRYLYDASPLPQRDLVQTEFQRFLEKDAMPVLESHAGEILKTVQDIGLEIGRNPAVRQTARESASALIHDPELRAILGQAIQDVFADTGAMRASLRRNWENEAGQRFATAIEEIIDPWLREAGGEIFGTPDAGLTPEFVAILRSQVLGKDKRWIVAPVFEGDSKTATTPRRPHLIEGKGAPMYPQWIEASSDPASRNR